MKRSGTSKHVLSKRRVSFGAKKRAKGLLHWRGIQGFGEPAFKFCGQSRSLKEALKQKYEPYKPDPDDPTYLADEFPDHVPYQPIDVHYAKNQGF